MNKEQLADQLMQLKDVLMNFFGQGVRDIGGLESAINRLKSSRGPSKGDAGGLKLNVPKLTFYLPKGHKHTLPAETKDSILSLSMTIEFSESEASFDSIKSMNVDLELSSYSEGRPLKSAWHLDFHEVRGDEKFSHPQFHFQFGGKRLRESQREENKPFNTGELLLMETPRIMHPPLDLVLAIDFVFGNYLGSDVWRRLRGNRSYKTIHGKSKEMYWKPYFSSLSQYFETPNPAALLKASSLHPGL